MAQQKIGFIGLGMMGAPMIRCLAKAGHALFLHDANEEVTDALCAELGAERLDENLASKLDLLITMLPNSDVVEAVLLNDGWASRLAPGATVIDMSSSIPMRSRALAKTLDGIGIRYLDAPVSGGVKRATNGSLAILVGGDADLLGKWRSALEAMGESILHIGPAGAGHAAKSLNNFVSAAGLMATVEALHVAERFGIEPEAMTRVLNASTGQTNTSRNKVEQFMLSGSFASGFSLKLMDKDLGIARDLADSVSYPLAFGRHGIEHWHRIATEAGPTTDHTEMYALMKPEA